MREIVLDTETTVFDPSEHRVVEIGCIELFNHVATGKEFHAYLNPERDMPAEAEAVHGLSREFLADKPLFAAVAEEILAFIADAPVVAHNAGFDLGFINAELKRAGRPTLAPERTIDTVVLARRKFPRRPGKPGCAVPPVPDRHHRAFQARRASRRETVVAQVYLELVGGREPGLALALSDAVTVTTAPQERRGARAAHPHGELRGTGRSHPVHRQNQKRDLAPVGRYRKASGKRLQCYRRLVDRRRIRPARRPDLGGRLPNFLR